jgi:hypothetical protein
VSDGKCQETQQPRYNAVATKTQETSCCPLLPIGLLFFLVPFFRVLGFRVLGVLGSLDGTSTQSSQQPVRKAACRWGLNSDLLLNKLALTPLSGKKII